MGAITDTYTIGVDNRNLVLKTRGYLYVKVGEQYYEVDFRNFKTNTTVEDRTDYIIFINSKNEIDLLKYPGDDKLIVGLDRSLFVTKNGEYVNVTPEQEIPQQSLTQLSNLIITDSLSGDSSLHLDFHNSNINTDTLTVTKKVSLPTSMIKNRCCQTYKTTDEGVEYVAIDYSDMDFIDLTLVPEKLIVKSGVMIKSHIDFQIPVTIVGTDKYFTFEFKKGKLYIIYNNHEDIIQSILN